MIRRERETCFLLAFGRLNRTGLIWVGICVKYSSEWEIELRRGQNTGLRSQRVRHDEIGGV